MVTGRTLENTPRELSGGRPLDVHSEQIWWLALYVATEVARKANFEMSKIDALQGLVATKLNIWARGKKELQTFWLSSASQSARQL